MTHTVGDILPVSTFLNVDLLELPDFLLEKKRPNSAQNPFVYWSFDRILIELQLNVFCEEKHLDIL